MRNVLLGCLIGVGFCTSGFAWDSFTEYPPLRDFYHPVSTNSIEAQKAFSRGLLAIYAFNYDESYASFEKASQIDPHLAIAYWGMALALDQNTPGKDDGKSLKLIQKAQALSKTATPKEKMYIAALSHRFSSDPNAEYASLKKAYRDAMIDLSLSFPDDLDAATLAAESMMDSLDWQLWSFDGNALEGTDQIVELLESVLKRNPWHAGANHYYIHAVENSKDPQRALMSAYRLDGFLPEWGHLLHTPAHIYMKVGSYEKAAEANKKALVADDEYIKDHGYEGHYAIHYKSHSLSFLYRAYLWQDNYTKALSTAQQLEAFLRPFIIKMPAMQDNMLAPLIVYLYFHRWNEIIAMTKSPIEFGFATAYWHFARALAHINLGNFKEAEEERLQFQERKANLPNGGTVTSREILALSEEVLASAIAKAEGKPIQSIEFLRNAVDKLDHMDYMSWYAQIRQTLGASLIETNQAAEAESVFREALQKFPRNGRSLFGLSESLKAQKKTYYSVEREARDALRFATQPLTLKDL